MMIEQLHERLTTLRTNLAAIESDTNTSASATAGRELRRIVTQRDIAATLIDLAESSSVGVVSVNGLRHKLWHLDNTLANAVRESVNAYTAFTESLSAFAEL